jgi:hypothetical protein
MMEIIFMLQEIDKDNGAAVTKERNLHHRLL